jgi:uncharacterized protein
MDSYSEEGSGDSGGDDHESSASPPSEKRTARSEGRGEGARSSKSSDPHKATGGGRAESGEKERKTSSGAGGPTGHRAVTSAMVSKAVNLWTARNRDLADQLASLQRYNPMDPSTMFSLKKVDNQWVAECKGCRATVKSAGDVQARALKAHVLRPAHTKEARALVDSYSRLRVIPDKTKVAVQALAVGALLHAGMSAAAAHRTLNRESALGRAVFQALSMPPMSASTVYLRRDEAVRAFTDEIRRRLAGEKVTLVIDETSLPDRDRNGLVACLACAPLQEPMMLFSEVISTSLDHATFARCLLRGLDHVGVPIGNVVAIQADGASYVDKAFKNDLFEAGIMPEQRHRCFVHALHRVADTFLRLAGLQTVIRTVRDLVGKQGRSMLQKLTTLGAPAPYFSFTENRWGYAYRAVATLDDKLDEIVRELEGTIPAADTLANKLLQDACGGRTRALLRLARHVLKDVDAAMKALEGDNVPAATALPHFWAVFRALSGRPFTADLKDLASSSRKDAKPQCAEVIEKYKDILREAADVEVEKHKEGDDRDFLHGRVQGELEGILVAACEGSLACLAGTYNVWRLLRWRALFEPECDPNDPAIRPYRSGSIKYPGFTCPGVPPWDVPGVEESRMFLALSSAYQVQSSEVFWRANKDMFPSAWKHVGPLFTVQTSSAAAERAFSRLNRASQAFRQSSARADYREEALWLATVPDSVIETLLDATAEAKGVGKTEADEAE